jgi:hypothetical protein
MAINKQRLQAALTELLNNNPELLAACAAATGEDRPEDVANSIILVLQKIVQQ